MISNIYLFFQQYDWDYWEMGVSTVKDQNNAPGAHCLGCFYILTVRYGRQQRWIKAPRQSSGITGRNDCDNEWVKDNSPLFAHSLVGQRGYSALKKKWVISFSQEGLELFVEAAPLFDAIGLSFNGS